MTDSDKYQWQGPPLTFPAGAGNVVATAVSTDSLIEAQNDAAEAMFAATRALFQHAMEKRIYVTIHSRNNLHGPLNLLVTEVNAYSANLSNFKLWYEDIDDISHDPETDSLHVTGN